MDIQRLSVGLTVVNLFLFTSILISLSQPAVATTGAGAPVLRGQRLEIVDQRGGIRASIKVEPAGTFKPTGRKYPETVMLRLIDPNGRPEVKIGASVEGAGVGLVGDVDGTQLILQADSAGSSMRLKNVNGGERLIQP
jgi:hypothetical protein